MLTLIGGLKVFSEVFVLTGGGPGNASQVVGTIILRSFGEGSWGWAQPSTPCCSQP